MDSGIMLSKSSIELILRDARCNLRSDDKNCHVCWSGVEGASVACRAKVLAEMQRKDEWTEQVCGVSHFRANAEGSWFLGKTLARGQNQWNDFLLSQDVRPSPGR
jgi:hypothetical protein